MTTKSFISRCAPGELEQLVAVRADWKAPDFVTIRAVAVSASSSEHRLAKLTGMGPEFVVEARRRAQHDGVAALLGDPPTLHERIVESATHQLLTSAGRDALTMQQLSRDVGIARRTLYNYSPAKELGAACRRRAQTVWRAHFEQRVVDSSPDAKRRLFALIEEFDAWVGSERFRADQPLFARASFSERIRDDDLREHLTEVERFGTGLAAAAGLADPRAFGAFVATSVAGASGWFDRRAAARAAGVAFIERALSRTR